MVDEQRCLTVGSLFSGIGGFDLGLERAGMRTVWFCEQDEFCQRVLAKHWPGVPCYPDVCELTGGGVAPVDVLCGGFPCQDISWAGPGEGIGGARSGLWSEFARLVGELRPRYVLVENVSALLARGMGVVVGDLAALGYDAEWDCLPASAVGAPHQRDRVWIVAYPAVADPSRLVGSRSIEAGGRGGESEVSTGDSGSDSGAIGVGRTDGRRAPMADVDSWPAPRQSDGIRELRRASAAYWESEPGVRRVADGVPDRLDRLGSLGNALVPQIAEWIGRRIVSYERG